MMISRAITNNSLASNMARGHRSRWATDKSCKRAALTCSKQSAGLSLVSFPPLLHASGYFSRTWSMCSHMAVKPSLFCTRKCGCKCGCMSACSRHATVRLVRPPSWNTILSQGKPCTCKNSLGTVRGISTVNSNVAWCRTVAWWLHVEMQQHLQPHFLVQYNGGFTTMWLHLDHVL